MRAARRTRTAETYDSAVRSLLRYHNSADLRLADISPSLIRDYQAWLIGSDKTSGTVSFYLRNLRAIYNHAVDDSLVTDIHPFRNVYTGTPETIRRALTVDELRRLYGYDIPPSEPSMRFARDMFILSYLLRGMSLVDIACLRKTNLCGDRLEYRRRKTGRPLSLAWTPEMQKIVARYADESSPYLLPVITDLQSPLKSFRTASQRIYRNLRALSGRLDIKYGRLTFYMARHTWASLARDAGIPISVISAAMGHSTEATTRIYLTSLDPSRIDQANTSMISLLSP